ncbi:glutaminase [Flavobacterium sp. K5-23]|uniref:glutaminase n=1 Tax=Flavobacterium sp. K5-23 TaxID=2746225 RepID=UPI00200E9347|nr:glutaminase [Flavobacterium sp. K5-23]UQD57562.1 glutaminase [Flavobacterium sp. K5-23]
MAYEAILKEIQQECIAFPTIGNVTTTIPELAKIDPNKFGIHITTIDGENSGIGDSEDKFSIQSISKALTVALAFSFSGESIWKRVGVEPSGTAFIPNENIIYTNFDNWFFYVIFGLYYKSNHGACKNFGN